MPDEIKPGEMPNEQDDATPDSDASSNEVEALRKALAKANREAAERRKKLEALEAAEEQRKQGEMSELEKAQKAKSDAEARAQSALAEANKRLVRAEFKSAASALGVKNPDDALALVIADGADIASLIDEAGNVASATEAVKALVDAGRLVTTGRPSAPGLDSGAGGGNRPTRTIELAPEQKRLAQIAGMTEQQYIDIMIKGLTGQQESAQDEALSKLIRS